jgi:perosamine synthetase
MKMAIPRYGLRFVPGSLDSAFTALREGRGVQGPEIREFEHRFAAYHGRPDAVTASYGRMAFYYILRALALPPGSEIIFPALTFWVIPEMARICGLRPVFVDIDSRTFNIDPEKIEEAITPRTRAIVPTHLYGQPCEMTRIMSVSRAHKLIVIEDCAHSLGATYQGARTGTFGDAALFSFQLLKGLNAYGGGMAIAKDAALTARIRSEAEREPWPTESEVKKRLLSGQVVRALISRTGFTFGLFIPFYVSSFLGHRDLSRYLWEKIRPLDPLPESYRRRFSNAQAIVAMKGLENLDVFNGLSRANAERLTKGLAGLQSIVTPLIIPGAVSTFYQYCIQTADPERLSRLAIRRGIDIEIMHVDICSELALFAEFASACTKAERTKDTLQLPVYASLNRDEVDRILTVIGELSRVIGAIPFEPANERTESPESLESRASTKPAGPAVRGT